MKGLIMHVSFLMLEAELTKKQKYIKLEEKTYKVAHVKHPPPLALRGNRKNTSFFVFLKFFHFCRRMPKQEQKQSKNWGKTCKILTFFFPTTYEYVTKSAFFLPYIWTFVKMSYMGRKWKKSFFCCLFYALIWAL